MPFQPIPTVTTTVALLTADAVPGDATPTALGDQLQLAPGWYRFDLWLSYTVDGGNLTGLTVPPPAQWTTETGVLVPSPPYVYTSGVFQTTGAFQLTIAATTDPDTATVDITGAFAYSPVDVTA